MPPKTKKYKKAATKKTIIVQGFNIQSDGNILKGASVVNNISESNVAEEEMIIQGFNLTENSNNNDLESALVKDNRVVAKYKKDEKKFSEERGEEIENSYFNVSNINYFDTFTSQGSMINGLVITGNNTNFGTTNQSENNYSGEFNNQDGNMLIGNQQFRDDNNLVVNELPEQELQAQVQITPK